MWTVRSERDLKKQVRNSVCPLPLEAHLVTHLCHKGVM